MKNYLKIGFLISLAICAGNFLRAQDDQNAIVISHQVSILGNTKPIPVSLDGFSGEVESI